MAYLVLTEFTLIMLLIIRQGFICCQISVCCLDSREQIIVVLH